MRKFFGKMWVMVTSLVLFVLTSALLIGILAQPLFFVGNYYGRREYSSPIGDNFVRQEWINVNINNTLTMKQVIVNETTGEKREASETYWYYRDGKTLLALGDVETMTKEQYKDAVKQIKEMSETEFDEYKNMAGLRLTFVAMVSNSSGEYSITSYKNKAKVPALITVGCVELIALALVVTTVTCFVLNKKNKKEEPSVVETPTEDTVA